MKSSAKNIKLASVDDLFKTDEGRADDERERVQEIAISELHPFKDHPFKVLDDEKMMETVESVQQYGVLVPIIARPSPEGGYEIVSGHRRHRACELAGKETMPVIVRDLDDDEAKIAFNPAYELSFLKPKEQEMLIETMDYEQATPSLSQAQRLKQFSQDIELAVSKPFCGSFESQAMVLGTNIEIDYTGLDAYVEKIPHARVREILRLQVERYRNFFPERKLVLDCQENMKIMGKEPVEKKLHKKKMHCR